MSKYKQSLRYEISLIPDQIILQLIESFLSYSSSKTIFPEILFWQEDINQNHLLFKSVLSKT